MIYLFIRSLDPCGEGERAELFTFGTQERASAAWFQALQNDKGRNDLLEMRIISGTQLIHWQGPSDNPLQASDRELSDDDLQRSAIEGVPNLDGKENV